MIVQNSFLATLLQDATKSLFETSLSQFLELGGRIHFVLIPSQIQIWTCISSNVGMLLLPHVRSLTCQVLYTDHEVFGLKPSAKFLPARDIGFPLALEDATTMQVTVAFGACSTYMYHFHQEPGREATYQKMKAYRMVNQRLQRVDDSLIYAVTMLWILEVFSHPPVLLLSSHH